MSSKVTGPKFSIKGFSPLTTPDVLKSKKNLRKDKHKHRFVKTESHQVSDTESQVDEDIISFASVISKNLCHLHSDQESDILEFSPRKSKTGKDSTGKSELLHKPSTVDDSIATDILSERDISNTGMGKKSVQSRNSLIGVHQKSDSETTDSDDHRMTREKTHSPRKNISKELTMSKKKSPVKHVKHVKNKLSEENKDYNMESMENSDSNSSTEKKTAELRYKPEDEFSMKTEFGTQETELCSEDLKGKDLWLIKAPVDFDLKHLKGKDICLNGLQSLNTDTENDYEVHAFEDQNLNTSTFQPVLPSRTKKTYTAGSKFKGQIHIIQTINVPPLPEIVIPSPVKHKIPPGLKPRFEPFGSASPEGRAVTTMKHGKRKHHTDRENDLDLSSKSKKKKRKHKHH